MAKATTSKAGKAKKETQPQDTTEQSTAVELIQETAPVKDLMDDSITAEQMKAAVIQQISLPHSQIAQWKQDYGKLKIKDLKDVDNIKAVTEARKIVRKARTDLDKRKDEIKKPILEKGKIIEGVYKELYGLIVEVETPLAVMLEKVEMWEKQESERIEKEQAERLDGRINQLQSAGMVYSAGYYCIAEISTDVSTVKILPDADFEILLAKVKFAADKIAAEKAEQKRIDDERAAQEQAEREKLAADQKKLDDERADFAKKQQDFENQQNQLRLEKIKVRQQRLESIGLTFKVSQNIFEFENPIADDCAINGDTVKVCADEDFEKYLSGLQAQVIRIKADMAEAAEKAEQERKATEGRKAQEHKEAAALYQTRVNLLHGISMLYTNGTDKFIYQDAGKATNIYIGDALVKSLSSEDFEDLYNDQVKKIEAYQQDKKLAEEKRLADLEATKPEIQLIREYIKKVKDVPGPAALKNIDMLRIYRECTSGIFSALESCERSLDDAEKGS